MAAYRKSAKLIVLVLAFLSVEGLTREDIEGWHPSTSEAVLLPRFCWAQFFGEKFKGPEYEIPRDACGVGTNHYCPALVLRNRANKSFNKTEVRRGLLLDAEKKTLYTLKAIEKFPRCPLRDHIEKTYELIEAQLREIR